MEDYDGQDSSGAVPAAQERWYRREWIGNGVLERRRGVENHMISSREEWSIIRNGAVKGRTVRLAAIASL